MRLKKIIYKDRISKQSNKLKKIDFHWYITSMYPYSAITKACIFSIKKYSQQPIKSIIVPNRIIKSGDSGIMCGIPIERVDASIVRPAGLGHKRKYKMDEEHASLLANGLKIFPCAVIDCDVWITSEEIDNFIRHHKERMHLSWFQYFEDNKNLWIWYEIRGRLKAKRMHLPLIHIGGIGSLKHAIYGDVEANFSRVEGLIKKAFKLLHYCPQEVREEIVKMKHDKIENYVKLLNNLEKQEKLIFAKKNTDSVAE